MYKYYLLITRNIINNPENDEIHGNINSNHENEETTDGITEVSPNVTDDKQDFGAYIERLSDLQHRIEHGSCLLNTFDNDERTRAIYDGFLSNLNNNKEATIDEMIQKVKTIEEFKDLNEKQINEIREYIDTYSCWEGFEFNVSIINGIIKKSKQHENPNSSETKDTN